MACTALVAFALLYATSCTKPIDGAQNRPLDYALQVIPDIHEVMPHDLIEAMNDLNALHFGDNPPRLSKTINDTLLGFVFEKEIIAYDSITNIPKYGYSIVKKYIPYSIPVSSFKEDTTIYLRPFYYLYHDQHRGIAQFDFKDNQYDMGPDMYVYDIAHVKDSVFIMGEGDYFTSFLFMAPERKHSPNITPIDFGPHLAVILSGKVTDNGIEEFYYGYKVVGYTTPPSEEFKLPRINDIIVLAPLVNPVPFKYWDPNQTY